MIATSIFSTMVYSFTIDLVEIWRISLLCCIDYYPLWQYLFKNYPFTFMFNLFNLRPLTSTIAPSIIIIIVTKLFVFQVVRSLIYINVRLNYSAYFSLNIISQLSKSVVNIIIRKSLVHISFFFVFSRLCFFTEIFWDMISMLH